jgi:hypothetical protein
MGSRDVNKRDNRHGSAVSCRLEVKGSRVDYIGSNPVVSIGFASRLQCQDLLATNERASFAELGGDVNGYYFSIYRSTVNPVAMFMG